MPELIGKRYGEVGINVKSNHFKRYLKSGLLNKIDESLVREVQKYWRINYGKEIDPALHLAFHNLTGEKELKIIPPKEMWHEIIPYFNDMRIRVGYSDKNIYDILICNTNSVETVLKRVRGNYFRKDNRPVDRQEINSILLDCQCNMIIKPSNTDNGVDVKTLSLSDGKGLILEGYENKIGLDELEQFYGPNFIIQETIVQHPVMAAPHPPSVNTLRMVTLRWNNEIKHLLTFARFGCHGKSTDNAGTGGLCVGITETGEFMKTAVDKDAIIYSHHPTTNYHFDGKARVPNFEYFKEFVVSLHKDILHHDFVSWDIAVGMDGQPIFLEANYRGATWLYQLACQRSLFGELTEEILQHIRKSKKHSRDIRPISTKAEPGSYAKKYIIHGLVQDVGFRKWIKRKALASNLNGHCRYLKNGRVEVVVSGMDEAAVDTFKNDCFLGPRRAQVINVTDKLWDRPVEQGFVVKKTEAEVMAAKFKEMKAQNKVIKKELSKQIVENKKIGEKYNKMKQSRFWRYGKPLREAVRIIKSAFIKAS